MHYLVYSTYVGCSCHDVVLGVCESINEVVEIVWVFSRFVLQVYGHTYEENKDLIQIAVITKDHYDVLLTLYDKYESALEEYKDQTRFKDWTDCDTLNVLFWNGVFYSSEQQSDIVFSQADCEVIRSIVSAATLLE